VRLDKDVLDDYCVHKECILSFDIKEMLSVCANIKKKDRMTVRIAEQDDPDTLTLVIHRNSDTGLTEEIKCPVSHVDADGDLNFAELVPDNMFVPTATAINLDHLAVFKSEFGNKRDTLSVSVRGPRVTFSTRKKFLYPISIVCEDGDSRGNEMVDFQTSGYVANILQRLHALSSRTLLHRVADSWRECCPSENWIGMSSSLDKFGRGGQFNLFLKTI
jgi:hypothetical protein